jgi:hypothetical protein
MEHDLSGRSEKYLDIPCVSRFPVCDSTLANFCTFNVSKHSGPSRNSHSQLIAGVGMKYLDAWIAIPCCRDFPGERIQVTLGRHTP